jgi:hypothetical protein
MFRERVGTHLALLRAINLKGERTHETGTLPDLWKTTNALA